MGRSIHTEILINAPAQQVWSVVADLARYRRWNPLIVEIEGELSVGERLRVSFQSGQTVRPVVTELRPGKSFEWVGTFAARWLFAARHRFELIDEGGQARFVHSEQFTGLLVPVVGRMLARMEASFRDMNTALQRQVEEGDLVGTKSRNLA